MDPKVIYFDLGDTLVYTRASYYRVAAFWAAIYLVLEKGRLIWPWTLSRLFKQAFRDELLKRNGRDLNDVTDELTECNYWYKFFEQVLFRFGLTRKYPTLTTWLARRYMDSRSYACFPEVHDVLSYLKSLDIELGILSNAFPSAEKIVRDLDLMKYFKFIVFSYEILPIRPKPYEDIYQYALSFPEIRDKIQRYDQVWFVDDRPEFVAGAKKLGINAVLIERDTDTHDRRSRLTETRDGEVRGVESNSNHIRISSLEDLFSRFDPVNQKAPDRLFECCIARRWEHNGNCERVINSGVGFLPMPAFGERA